MFCHFVRVYNVEVKHAGFRGSTQTGVEITIERAVVDFKLEVGAIGQQIEGAASPPLVESSNATIGEVITNEKDSGASAERRSFAQLALLAPQVISGGVGVGNGQADLQNTSIGTQGRLPAFPAREMNPSVQFTWRIMVTTNSSEARESFRRSIPWKSSRMRRTFTARSWVARSAR